MRKQCAFFIVIQVNCRFNNVCVFFMLIAYTRA